VFQLLGVWVAFNLANYGTQMQLMGIGLEETSSTITDPDLLMEVMEVRMQLEEAEPDQLRKLEVDNKEKLDHCYAEIGKALGANDQAKCRDVAMRLQYYVKVDEEIKKRKQVV